MASTIDQAFVNQFKDNVLFVAQQKESRLRSTVRTEMFTGEDLFVDRLGKIEAEEKTTRHKATPIMDQPHSRRRVRAGTWQVADVVDNDDKLKMLISPESQYVKSFGYSLGRKMDDLVIAAAVGAAAAGKTGSTTVNYPAGNEIGTGAAAFTLADLLALKFQFDSRDVDPDGRTIVISAKALSQLLADDKISSADYNTVKALVRGELDTYLGFRFVMSNRLAIPAANQRRILAYHRDGIVLGINQEPITRIAERADLSFATQIYMEMTVGAVRIDEDMVFSALISEA